MNLKMSDIKIGDIFIETKKLGGYDFIDAEFEVEEINVDESAILLSLKTQKNTSTMLSFVKLYLSLDELNNHFKKAKKFVWGDWKEIATRDWDFLREFGKSVCFYKTNGRIVFVKIIWNNKSFKGKATCHNEDLEEFNLQTGVTLARSRALKKLENYQKELNSLSVTNLEIGDKVKAINNDNRSLEYIYSDAEGIIKDISPNTLYIEWYKDAQDVVLNKTCCWYIEPCNVEKINEEKDVMCNFKLFELNANLLDQPVNYTILHTLYACCNGETIGLTKEIIDLFDIKKELIEELDYFKNLVEYYSDSEYVIGDIITYPYKNVISLITKEHRGDIVQYSTIKKGLNKVKKYMEENNIHYLAMPRICCGYEKLEWERVKDIINDVFIDCKIPITIRVCHREY